MMEQLSKYRNILLMGAAAAFVAIRGCDSQPASTRNFSDLINCSAGPKEKAVSFPAVPNWAAVKLGQTTLTSLGHGEFSAEVYDPSPFATKTHGKFSLVQGLNNELFTSTGEGTHFIAIIDDSQKYLKEFIVEATIGPKQTTTFNLEATCL